MNLSLCQLDEDVIIECDRNVGLGLCCTLVYGSSLLQVDCPHALIARFVLDAKFEDTVCLTSRRARAIRPVYDAERTEESNLFYLGLLLCFAEFLERAAEVGQDVRRLKRRVRVYAIPFC